MATTTYASRLAIGSAALAFLLVALTSSAQSPNGRSVPAAPTAKSPVLPPPLPPEYLIGPDDVLSINFWRDKDLSSDVVVRPDGKISLILINEVHASGLTPEQLRLSVTAAAARFVEEPTVTIVVKQINSRRVYLVGQVAKPGIYPLGGPMTVVQLIALAGGLSEYADRENIVVMRAERRPDGEPLSVRVNWADLMKRRNLKQNIDLKPGDTVMVP